MQIKKKKQRQVSTLPLVRACKQGFTLAELLIVVAIIGVLTAVAIPVFSSQLEKSREATDIANLRSVKAAAVAKYLDNDTTDGVYYFDAQRGILVSENDFTADSITGYGKGTAKSGADNNNFDTSTFANGSISISWVDTDGTSNENTASYASNSNVSGQIIKVAFDKNFVTNDVSYGIVSVSRNTLTSLNSVDGNSVAVDGNQNVSFRSEADISKFVMVKVNDTIVDESNYTLTEGSTIVTLKQNYVASLGEGNHSVSIVSTDGEATSSLKVVAQKNSITMPGFCSFDIQANTTEIVNRQLFNPIQNEGSFKMDFKVTADINDDGVYETIFETEEPVYPGERIEGFTISEPINAGTYPCKIYINPSTLTGGSTNNGVMAVQMIVQ